MKKITIVLAFVAVIQVFNIGCNKQQTSGSKGRSSSNIGTDTTSDFVSTAEDKPIEAVANFVEASKLVTPAVVHIRVSVNIPATYGNAARSGMGSGSGVIITANGYIATNNHVVENASKINVTLPDKRSFTAKLVGRDPNTDLALLKVDADSLPIVKFGNSDKVEVGEWVLAVGFPLSLNTTVTAGIVSAKARNIGIINRPDNKNNNNSEVGGNTAVESFIQTDAAINPGNSGGALVNTNGALIGINSAIASQTGSYTGYSFAIPVNLAKKILDDLRKYGTVKRGILGVSFPSPSGEDRFLAEQGLNPADVKGVYITGVQSEGAAAKAGLKEGDIIQSLDGVQLNSSTEFSEYVARHEPGDVIKLGYLRKGKKAITSATLKEETSQAPVAKSVQSLEEIYNRLGARFGPLTNTIRQQYNLNSGVIVEEIKRDGFFERVGIPPGTIIAFINGKPINNPTDIEKSFLSAQRGLIQIFAIAPDGSKVVFNFSLGT
ncbi:HtrA protease/chaperone protein [Arcticibacter svalbardensis MN12-7]|uniref:HtrA protease/chaperone protein n=1 Tax=Arcticibacter svalbardensis MN12-7 TaxID=1150600 RepID=R9GN74_9SPHI|nr:trypsin-like peptidase domain-containing protein [Arcticibacter svalbardensis]EOR93292.1 HtrA protease/chaperone protein [Arcticibacter svalbardensis MN12-7]